MKEEQLKILSKLSGNELIEYVSKLSIKSILVFGSAITEEFNEESDVDMKVKI